MSGVWYSSSMASDDMRRIEEDGDLRVFISSIQSLDNGNLRFQFYLPCVPPCPLSWGRRCPHARTPHSCTHLSGARRGTGGCHWPGRAQGVLCSCGGALRGLAEGLPGRPPPPFFRLQGQCEKVAVVCEKTQRSGVYTISCKGTVPRQGGGRLGAGGHRASAWAGAGRTNSTPH